MEKRSVTDFFENDSPSYGSYDNIRKIPNFIDGFKISQRKLVWTGFSKASKEFIKTETFCNLTSLETAYIHGSANLCGVCDSLVQNFIGACNYPFFDGNSGGWGSRIVPRSSAPRYTRLKLNNMTKILFNEIDNKILEKQFFEGQYIEPRFLIPIFPVIFLNPSDGLSTGFASHIYSRDPKEIVEYIKRRLIGKDVSRMKLLPWFKNFKGTIKHNKENNSNESYGLVVKKNTTKYIIEELPIGIDYQKYINTLDKLCDNNIIVDYEDKCDPKTDTILFEIKTTREFTNKHKNEEDVYNELKLIKTLPENLNCIDANNRVKEYNDVKEILEDYIRIRIDFYGKRKNYILLDIKSTLEKLVAKFLFCKGIINKTIVVANKKKADIESQLEKVNHIIKIDGSFDYLTNMPIHSVTKEKMAELKNKINELKDKFKTIKAKTVQDLWIEDLDAFLKEIK